MKLLNVPKDELGIFWGKPSNLACFLQPVSCHMSCLIACTLAARLP